MKRLSCFVLLVCILTACRNAPQSAAESPVAATTIPAASTLAPTCEAVTIFYEESAQFELINAQGQRVMIDVIDPRSLSTPPAEKDILATTHIQHNDHFSSKFSKSFPGQQLNGQVGKIELADVAVEGIASSHTATGEWSPDKGSNTFIIVDMGGMRIVHFGGIGQEALTSGQLDALGEVDIALMQLNNPSSQMTAQNKKAFNLMDQVQPRLIIVTHNNQETAEAAVQKWPGLYTDQRSIKLCKDELPAQTQILFMGRLATSYQAILNLSRAGWQ